MLRIDVNHFPIQELSQCQRISTIALVLSIRHPSDDLLGVLQIGVVFHVFFFFVRCMYVAVLMDFAEMVEVLFARVVCSSFLVVRALFWKFDKSNSFEAGGFEVFREQLPAPGRVAYARTPRGLFLHAAAALEP